MRLAIHQRRVHRRARRAPVLGVAVRQQVIHVIVHVRHERPGERPAQPLEPAGPEIRAVHQQAVIPRQLLHHDVNVHSRSLHDPYRCTEPHQ